MSACIRPTGKGEENGKEDKTVFKKKETQGDNSIKIISLSLKLVATVVIVGLFALAIYFATGKGKNSIGLENSPMVQEFLDGLQDTTEKMSETIGEYSKDEIESIYRDITDRERYAAEQEKSPITGRDEACSALYSILASIEDPKPLEMLRDTINQKAGYNGDGQQPNYVGWMTAMSASEWKEFLTSLDRACPETSRALKQLYPNILRKAQG